MRAVYLNPCGQLGGAETSLLEMLASIRATAPAWEIYLVLGEDGPLAAEARRRGADVRVAPFPAALARLGDARERPVKTIASLLRAAVHTMSYRRRLARILRELRPDVIHTNGFKMHVLGAWARPRGAALVWHIHDYVSTRRLMSRLLRVFQGKCAMAIANSQSVASDIRAVLPRLDVIPIYNAVDLKRFSASGTRLDLDALAGLPAGSEGVVRVGLIGTFARWKGHQVFLQALARLPQEMNVRGYIIGGPIYQTNGSQWSLEELQKEADRLRLSGRVGFTGFLRDVPEAIRSLDIVVHASTEPEPFGMVIIEAMACGKAVIASRAGGAVEIFSDGVNAVGHKPGDAADLADQIATLARDERFRKRIEENARAAAETLYGRERLGRELLAVYDRVRMDSGAGAEDESEPALSQAAK